MKFSFRQQYFANSFPSFSLLPHVLALAMTHILLTLVYEETALISAMHVWVLLIICIDVDLDGNKQLPLKANKLILNAAII